MFEGFDAFVQNPMMFMAKTRFKIPQEIKSTTEMVNYLLQSGQLTQDQYNQVYSQYRNLLTSGQLPHQG